MGWWSLPEHPSVILGDEAMDATYDYLERLDALYNEACSRKPTLDEIQAIFALALRVAGDRTVANLEPDREIHSVTIKTTPRPKKQKYAVGDVFTVPLSDGRWSFGRIVNLADGWNLVEIFRQVSDTPRYSNSIAATGRLFPPIWINPREVFEGWKWKIVATDAAYSASDLDELRYAMGTPGNYQWVKVNGFRPEGRVTDREAEKLPQWAMLTADAAVNKIESALRQG